MKDLNRIDSPEVRVVEASAGSGKTYCLAVRYLKLLINPGLKLDDIPLNGIAAITFSNKAALEMKERITRFLKMLALDSFPNPKEKEALLSYLSVDEGSARQKALKIMDEIIRHYNSFRVQTIDSFINAILCGCAFKFGLSSAFRIKNDYREYLSYSFDRVIEAVNKDSQARDLFLNFLRQYLFVERKKSWFPKPDILAMLEFLFHSVNAYGAPLVKYEKDFKDVIAKRERIFCLMLKLKKCMPEGANLQSWGGFIDNLNEKTSASGIDRFLRPFSKDAFPIRKGALLNPDALGLWQEIKDTIRGLREDEAFSLFNCYIDIFNSTALFFREFSQEEDIIFLPELNSRMLGLFSGEEALVTVPELYYRLAAVFRHFLIDEFQDTSQLQWKNLFPMVEEALSSGGSLFYVGDKKQAIYRFRGGDAYLMERIGAGLKPFNLKKELLNHNYRSQKEIVEFNNRVFSRENLLNFLELVSPGDKDGVSLEVEDRDEIAGVFKEAEQEYKKEKQDGLGYGPAYGGVAGGLGYGKPNHGLLASGRVSFEVVPAGEGEADFENIIKEKTVSLIKELKERFEYQDIAVLARSNREVENISSWLISEGLPVESEKTLNIAENPRIKELTAFLRFLNSPIDNLAFASFILGDIFSQASGISGGEIRDFLFRISLKGGFRDYLYVEFRGRFPRAWKELIEGFYKNTGFIPLYELCVGILDKFKVMGNFPQAQGFFMRFLELIKLKEEDAQSLPLFLEYFESAPPEDLYVYSSANVSVKAMTIHKAKGLEFAVVIIPFLEMSLRLSGGQENQFFVFSGDSSLRLVYLTKEGALVSPVLNNYYRQELKKAFIDELNCIYVAFTRAKYGLYGFIPEKASGTRNPAVLLLSPITRLSLRANEVSEAIPMEIASSPASGGSPRNDASKQHLWNLPPSVYKDWTGFLREEFEDTAVIRNRDKIFKGEVKHYLLSCLGNILGLDLDEAVSRALERTIARYPLVYPTEELEGFLRSLLSNPGLKKFFFAPEGCAYTEKELVDSRGNTRRIDRLIITKDEAWVVDYKSSRLEAEEGKKQLQEYMGLVSQIYPGLKVKGYLIYLDNLELADVPPP